MYYKEAENGQILEEGITEAGSMASFNAAGTAYSSHGINMIPFFIYYSMFGFQRIGDLIWAAADMRAKGFMIGATAGRTTLNGEGLQHQDGHSLLNAIAFPTVRAYDPAFAYETAVIIFDGLRRLYQEGETAIYYITVENENYPMPTLPEGVAEGIVRGIYRVAQQEAKQNAPRVQLFGSGAILRSVLDAQQMLAERYGMASDVWSVTSYSQLRREAQECRRWNMLHPGQPPRKSYLEQVIDGVSGPFIAASDYVRAVPEQLNPWIPGDWKPSGTDGMGRSDTRENLRRHFEVDAAAVTVAALHRLHENGSSPQIRSRRPSATWRSTRTKSIRCSPDLLTLTARRPTHVNRSETARTGRWHRVRRRAGCARVRRRCGQPGSAALRNRNRQSDRSDPELTRRQGAEGPRLRGRQCARRRPARDARSDRSSHRGASDSCPRRTGRHHRSARGIPTGLGAFGQHKICHATAATAAAARAPRHATGVSHPGVRPAGRRCGTGHGRGRAGNPTVAREVGVDLRHVPGTGPGGRITREDVLAVVRSSAKPQQPAPSETPPGDLPEKPSAPAATDTKSSSQADAADRRMGTDSSRANDEDSQDDRQQDARILVHHPPGDQL